MTAVTSWGTLPYVALQAIIQIYRAFLTADVSQCHPLSDLFASLCSSPLTSARVESNALCQLRSSRGIQWPLDRT